MQLLSFCLQKAVQHQLLINVWLLCMVDLNLLQLFFNSTVSRWFSTNSYVAANLQKVIHVLVGLLMQ